MNDSDALGRTWLGVKGLFLEINHFADDFDPRFKIFHELMQWKVRDILLVSSLYDACIMEEDCRLAERIINEYRGLNLSKPPRLTWMSSAEEALAALDERQFDLVITMPRLADMDAHILGREIKKKTPGLPVILLTHQAAIPEGLPDREKEAGIDRTFIWTGNADLLLAQIKSVEDRVNVSHDTQAAGVRVILFIEDSPIYMSSLLPILYREVVTQTQAVLEEKLNEEHKLLTMRARAKILVGQTYEEAVALFDEFKPYVLGVISDVRFPMNSELNGEAGVHLFKKIRGEIPDIPFLLTSSEASNQHKVEDLGASFVDKNSPTLHRELHEFFLKKLGFGDFVFRLPDGTELMRVSTVRALEKALVVVPRESFIYHSSRNDFSRWLFARTETLAAMRVRPLTFDDFDGDVESGRQFLISSLKARRKWRQKGVVVDFDPVDFDPDTDFLKIGKGSLGGKARGLAFISTLLQRNPALHKKYPDVEIIIPRTLVVTTECFDQFIETNDLKGHSKSDTPDEEIAAAFLAAEFPDHITRDLRAYLDQVRHPVAVRSSGLLEDAQFRAYAGLYRTYMIPNDHPDLEARLSHLIEAIKLVYASTYFEGPKSFARRVGQRTEEEKMGVIIQQLIGETHHGFFYPAISGVAQSYNFYPFSRMKQEDGIASIALGLGRTVVEGGRALRFSPRRPELLPQFSTVDDILKNSQKYFYALRMGGRAPRLGVSEATGLERREVSEAADEAPVRLLASTYIPEEHRLRDSSQPAGPKVITFAPVLKHKLFPLAAILSDILDLGREGMGCPVEIEFSVHLPTAGESPPRFSFLQIRPMTARAEMMAVTIAPEEKKAGFCYSTNALGNADRKDIRDILYVKPDVLDPAKTVEIAREIGRLNVELVRKNRPYLLIGPGRWGSADRWLGIPVEWTDISGVAAVVETTSEELKAEPSQGSHFFHNVTTLGINYLSVREEGHDFLDWDWLTSLPITRETSFMAHVGLEKPIHLKVDGRKAEGVMFVD
ncbi:MAG: PEP/pyruvate-binding domain-containing protein [Pseudomonadota bacterium]